MLVTVSIQTFGVSAGYLGAALGVGMVVPQIARTFRDRARAGVSAMSWALTALSCLAWMLYGIRTDEVPQIPGNILIVAGSVVIVLAVPSAVGPIFRGIGLAAASLVVVALSTVLPPSAIGFLGFGIGLVSAIPQTMESLTRRTPGASAVSIPAWLLRAASQLCWLFYALVAHDLTVTISAVFILSSALLLIASELRHRPAAPNHDVPLSELATAGSARRNR